MKTKHKYTDDQFQLAEPSTDKDPRFRGTVGIIKEAFKKWEIKRGLRKKGEPKRKGKGNAENFGKLTFGKGEEGEL